MTSPSLKMVHSLYEDGGEGSAKNPRKFNGQDFNQIKKSLLSSGKKFEDASFPANLKSLGKLEGVSPEQLSEVKWLRPKDLNPDASFVKDGASRFDFRQGQVGNCWFLVAIGALTFRKSLMAEVVPPDQSFKSDYAGIFHFRFWRFGKWEDVVIDDLLPTIYGAPVSVSSKSGNEFWAPLLEKAYAKISGSYGDMIAGVPCEAFKDFSGGVYMNYTLANSEPDLWAVMNRAVKSKTMMGCGTFQGEKGKAISTRFGLVEGHAFTVTGVKQVKSAGKNVNLVRIWNPWGEKEWNGDWSDKSELWKTLSTEDRDHCQKVREDGEFWMKLEDFCTYYQDMDICCDSPNFVDGDAACLWNCSQKEGRWQTGKSAGGSNNVSAEFMTNPQYRLKVKAGNDKDKGNKNVLVSLMQKPDEDHRSKVTYEAMMFFIYKVLPQVPKGKLPDWFFQYVAPLKLSRYGSVRELIEFYSFEEGEYVIIPCTYEANKNATFVITVYSKAESDME